MKLNINRLSIWMENGRPRFSPSNATEDEARAQVSEFIRIAEEWLSALDDRQEEDRKQRLTPQEERAVAKLLKLSGKPESEEERAAIIDLIRTFRTADF